MSADYGRRVHLVGSIPEKTTHDAMRLVIDTVGDRVTQWLPDGETGTRRNWIERLVENLRSHDDLELASDGDWSDYDATPRFRIKKSHTFDSVELDYFEHFEDSWPEFQKVRSDLGRPDLAFQIGIPGPIDVALAAFGFSPIAGFRNVRPFETATLREIEKVDAVAGDEVVYQLEIPIEVGVTTRIPSPIRGPGARWLARKVLRVVADSPEGTRWGFHLCVGDMNNEAFSRLSNAGPAVQLANALVAQFPTRRKLEFVHIPLAHGSNPPTTDRAFYEALGDLDLPADVRFIAGFAHERQSLEEQREVRTIIEDLIGHPVDVASSCGLGRRNVERATANLTQTRLLAE